MDRGFKYLIDQYRVEGARSKFEEIMGVLLKKINNGKAFAVEPHQGDKGVDIFIGDINASPDIYQCKFFCEGLDDSRKQQIKKSLNTALKNHSINKWTLCVPCTFNHDEHEWWCKIKKDYKGKNTNIKEIELYDEMQIITLLKENYLYDEFFNTVRMDKSFAENLYKEVKKLKAVNNSSSKITRSENSVNEYYNDASATYKCSTSTIDFNGFLPNFPDRIVGSCSIEFKRNDIKDILLTYNHKQIFSFFEKVQIKGKNYFISEKYNAGNNKFNFFLSNILLKLTKKEVNELLFIMDNYYFYYIRELKNIISFLEIDKFDESKEGILRIRILKVKFHLWNLMKKFANEHDYLNGDSKWHIFQLNWSGIHIYSPIISHNPRFDEGEHAYFNVEKTEDIIDDFVWVVLNLNMSMHHDTKLEQYNEKNIWGALTAYRWLIEDFLPKISKEYKLDNIENYIDDYDIKSKLETLRRTIINDLQMFYMSNNVSITDKEFESLKQALIFCLIKKELVLNEYDYILGKLGLRHSLQGNTSQEVIKYIIDFLKNHPFKSSSSLVDDFLRCILPFVDNHRTKNNISEAEFEILVSNLNPLIEKMQNIEFLRKYSNFSNSFYSD
ncbi:hypothetical protein ACNQFZ_08615 [Schinkia sp. CFF1]